MRLVEVLVPVYHNDRRRNYEAERKSFERWLLDTFGGFTRLPQVDGAWKDGAYVFADAMVPYRVAVDSDPATIVDKALEIFHDQKAIFMSMLGTAKTVERDG